jgi:hypothetical protein
MTLRHTPGESLLAGEAIETLTTMLAHAAPTGYGRHEPALNAWDLTRFAREVRRSPGEPQRFVVTGSRALPISLTISVERHGPYVDEHVGGIIGMGRFGDPRLGGRLERLDHALITLAEDFGLMFALAMARPGPSGLTRAPVMPHAPTPLSLALGPGLVDGLALNTEAVISRYRAHTVSHPDCLLIPLGDSDGGRPTSLGRLLKDVGFARATTAMGVSVPEIHMTRYAARF